MSELELTGEHVAELGDEDLRSLVVKLCEAELHRTGRPTSAVLAGGNQTAPDGGLDVRVQLDTTAGELASDGGTTARAVGICALKEQAVDAVSDVKPKSPQLDFILRADTGFQVKCESMPASAITKEMRPKGVLRASIQDLIARKGAYIIVSSKGTVADVHLGKRTQAMRDAVTDQPGHSDLKLDYYDRDRLARWVRQYPGVEFWVRERVNARLQGWQGYGCWAGTDVAYLLDDTARLVERTGGSAAKALSVAEGLGRLRAALRGPGQVLRVVGLSGTGKTRMVQALFEKNVGNGEPPDQGLVLYTDLGNEPEPSAREMLFRLGSKEQRAIVIVDNCNPKTHRTLASVVSQYNKHLSVLTVEYDVADEDTPDATDVYELLPASTQVLESILQRLAPHLTRPDRNRITEFSGGNARVALALARTVEKGETLGVLNDTELFHRLFRQGQAEDPELLRAAQACSLVYSFEGEDTKSEASELRVLANLVGMTSNELYRHVGNLKRRGLVQSRSKWRAVLPPALANRLAKRALQEIPSADITDAFAISERLLISFSRRLEYLHDAEEACAIASRWMADAKWLADPTQLNSFGRRLFINLAPLVPNKVLVAMERALSAGNAANFVLRHRHSMHEWSTLLRHLAYQPTSFDSAAPLLLTLAEHEEGNCEDCRGAWRELFRIGLSGTMAPPTQRVQLLERLLATSGGNRRELIWAAVTAMLEANHIISSHDFSFGARPHGYGWEPESHAEIVVWFEYAFSLLRRVAASGSEGLKWARSALSAHFRELLDFGLDVQLQELMLEVAGGSGWPAGWFATQSALRFDSEQMPPEMLKALKVLDAAMAPKGLAQQIRTYTLGQVEGFMDVADPVDDLDEAEDKNPVPSWEGVNERVVELGTAVASDDAVLEQVLSELLTEERGRQYYLGKGLGKATPDAERHWGILRDTFVNLSGEPNVALLAGFVNGVRNKDPQKAAVILNSVVEDAKLDLCYPVLLGAPQNDADGDRLIASMRRGITKPHLYTLRSSCGESAGLSVEKFCEAMEVLSEMENGLIAAIDELNTELHHWKLCSSTVPVKLAVLARTLLASFSFDAHTPSVAWRVNELAKLAFIGPEAVDAAARFAVRLATALGDYRNRAEDFGDVACTLFRLQPVVALDAFLSNPNPRRHLGFRARSIARNGPIVQCAPEEVLIHWVSADPEKRAPILAREIEILRKKAKENTSALDDSASEVTLSPLATSLLELVVDKAKVLEGFNGHLHPNLWSGSLAQTLAPYLALIENLVGHADYVVAAWARESLQMMRQRIESDHSTDSIREQSFE